MLSGQLSNKTLLHLWKEAQVKPSWKSLSSVALYCKDTSELDCNGTQAFPRGLDLGFLSEMQKCFVAKLSRKHWKVASETVKPRSKPLENSWVDNNFSRGFENLNKKLLSVVFVELCGLLKQKLIHLLSLNWLLTSTSVCFFPGGWTKLFAWPWNQDCALKQQTSTISVNLPAHS